MSLLLEKLGSNALSTSLIILVLAIWTIVWKGFALWIAAQENKKPWFIVILILNTAGILDIVYIFFFSGWGKKYCARWKEKRARRKGARSSSPREN